LSTKGKEYQLAVRIAGIIDKSFNTSLTTANSKLAKTVAKWDTTFTKLDKGFDNAWKAGKKCFSIIADAAGIATLAIGAATAASVAVGVEFESAFAGVKKTTEATAEEYEALRQTILAMTREIPASGAEIAEVMEVAGQLGIEKEVLAEFTEVMIKMGVSTNVAAEQAAESLARFANIMNMEQFDSGGISNYERLGSTVVDLGNKFATTESEIIDISTALAAAGNIAGLSEAEIMGISAAMASVGLTAEAGASSMSRLIMQMQQAVADGGNELRDYAEVAGMTGEEFAKLFRTDPDKAIIEFIEGLNEAGEGSYDILEDLELSTIRTRKAFLSLAGADDLLGKAIETANEAWNENLALEEEAQKRFITTESQLILMGNAFKELGIVAYDDLQEPFVGVISSIKESVNGFTDDLRASGAVGDWIQNIKNEFPTLQRNFKKFAEPVFNGIVGAGKWVVKNGKGIVSILAGIGATLATYKIASTVTHIVNALLSMPHIGAILGVAAAVTAVVSAFTAYKLHERELVENDLASHFGNIALSMEEIQAIAERIVGADSLGGVMDALKAFEDISVIGSNIESNIADLNRMNWKVSIGMELTPEEQEAYQATMDEYVASVQAYAEQSMYAVSLNLSIAFDDDSLESTNIVTKVNKFYQDKYDELADLGTQLSNAVSDAFEDGLFEFDEAEAIMKIQAQMATVQEALATSEFSGALAVLDAKYGNGTALTSDAFQNLQAELADQVQESTLAYDEALAKNYAAVQAAKDAGYLSDAEYNTAMEGLEDTYLKNTGDLQVKAIQFQIDTIMEAYGDEFGAMEDAIASAMEEWGDISSYEYGWSTNPVGLFDSVIEDAFNSNGIKKSTKEAIEKLWEELEPSVEELEALKQKYEAAGMAVPESVLQTLEEAYLIGAMTARRGSFGVGFKGDQQSAYYSLGSYIVNDEDYQWIEDILKGYEWELPKEINQRADGGLATRPELTWFAEKGPEMAIPIDGSQNAISLWEQTGRLLGMGSVLDGITLEGGTGPSIEYSPTLQFYGGTPSKDDLTEALRVSQDEFEELMDRYFKTHGRVSFG